MMPKNPAFQFYPGDWFREPGLQRVDLDVRGAWAELLMIMHFETPRGVTTGTVSGIARQLRVSVPRACHIISELDTNQIAEVTYQEENSREFIQVLGGQFRDMSPKCPDVSPDCPLVVSIKNRRMFYEDKVREYERLKKQKQRRTEKVPSDVPEMSRSLLHSPSPTPKNKNKNKYSSSDQAVERLASHPLSPGLLSILAECTNLALVSNGDSVPFWSRVLGSCHPYGVDTDQWLGLKLRSWDQWFASNPDRKSLSRKRLETRLMGWLSKDLERLARTGKVPEEPIKRGSIYPDL